MWAKRAWHWLADADWRQFRKHPWFSVGLVLLIPVLLFAVLGTAEAYRSVVTTQSGEQLPVSLSVGGTASSTAAPSRTTARPRRSRSDPARPVRVAAPVTSQAAEPLPTSAPEPAPAPSPMPARTRTSSAPPESTAPGLASPPPSSSSYSSPPVPPPAPGSPVPPSGWGPSYSPPPTPPPAPGQPDTSLPES
jgi:hypothetical protein